MISVYITSYNKGKYLSQAISSVLNQSLPVDELIIVDDNSSDESRDLITSYYNRYPDLIKPIFNEKNVGIAACRNIAIENCSGDLITFLDGDDYFYNEKIESEYHQLKANNDIQVVYSNFKYINKNGTVLGDFANINDQPAIGNIFITAIQFQSFTLFLNQNRTVL